MRRKCPRLWKRGKIPSFREMAQHAVYERTRSGGLKPFFEKTDQQITVFQCPLEIQSRLIPQQGGESAIIVLSLVLRDAVAHAQCIRQSEGPRLVRNQVEVSAQELPELHLFREGGPVDDSGRRSGVDDASRESVLIGAKGLEEETKLGNAVFHCNRPGPFIQDLTGFPPLGEFIQSPRRHLPERDVHPESRGMGSRQHQNPIDQAQSALQEFIFLRGDEFEFEVTARGFKNPELRAISAATDTQGVP
jgi:hypothetical protein